MNTPEFVCIVEGAYLTRSKIKPEPKDKSTIYLPANVKTGYEITIQRLFCNLVKGKLHETV